MYLSLIDHPKVSVVTAVLNGRSHIDQAVQSVLSQSYSNVEYIIIDGGSTDGTLDILDQYKTRICCLVSEPDHGIGDAFNKGVVRCSGDLIFILNSDDWMEADCIYNIVDAYRKFPFVDVFYGKCALVNQLSEVTSVHPRPNVHIHLGRYMALCHPSTILSRKAYIKFGLYNTNMKYAADYDLLLRILVFGGHFKFIDTVIANHRPGGASWENHELALAECEEARNRYFS